MPWKYVKVECEKHNQKVALDWCLSCEHNIRFQPEQGRFDCQYKPPKDKEGE